ncbi:4870_t:CDS:2 [Funneliformis caledonium]|uniref:4870_t:CDS:1 n=1 Tax=Funneliformis caledonium TaxID=1117310 RepID=A0A9N9HHG5_9GLOM|nr:4870_t:CDS:2 [Funneliformis caledonium]
MIPECQITTCSSNESSIIFMVKLYGLCLLVEAILFEIISIVLTFLLWRNKTWVVLKDFKVTRHKHIKRMYITYQIQTALVHAQIVMTLILAYTIWIMEILATHTKIIMFGADIEELWANPFLLYFIFQFYILLVLKAIRSESHLLMCVIYLGNIGEWLEVFLQIYHWCPIDLMNDSESRCQFWNLVNNNFWYKYVFIYTIVALFIILIQTINTIRCHRNFGKNFGFYLRYQDSPEFEYSDDIPSCITRNNEKTIELA